jgi:hypothetical protein
MGKQLPVHYFGVMKIRNSRYDLIQNVASLVFFETLNLFNRIIELGALTKFRNDIEIVIVLEKLVHFDDIWMILSS